MNYLVNNEWGKNQYQNLGDARIHQNANARSMVSTVVVGLCIGLLVLSLWSMSQRHIGYALIFSLDTRQSLTARTSTRFLSYGLDTSLLRDMPNLPINDKRFINLARHLSPAYVRVGGTAADCLVFNQTLSPTPEKVFDPVTRSDITNFTITDKDFLAIYNFAEQSGARMIFDLNVLLRQPNGYWDYSNAEQIITFAKGHNLEIDWQLGNEPNSFYHVFERNVTATQLATDYITLRGLLDKSGYESSDIIGPEVNHIADEKHAGERYASEFLEYGGSSVTYVSWHQYYLNGREAKVEDFVDPAVLNVLPIQIKSVADVIDRSGKDVYMWISETSSAYGGGAPELSDRFVAGFLWLDKLGYSARAGVNVVTRQSLFGGNYAMVSPNLTPNPDWWVSVFYKQFVSEKVLKFGEPSDGRVRFYLHCTPTTALLNRVPAVTSYGVNLNKEPVKFYNRILYGIPKIGVKTFLYILTADHLTSSYIKMNGETLMLNKNGDLPPFNPIIVDPTQPIFIPAYSMIFMVFHGIEVPACMT
ncbi:heparanase-like [Athalia rosae]|uniref:heparanase-like n=1 Tax=Athalia rosae TaxID=37344 RepID=UPI002033B0FF|nr:heparanase-like [Athalia rosae]